MAEGKRGKKPTAHTDPGLQLQFTRDVAAVPDQLHDARAQLRDELHRWQLSTRVCNAVLDVSHELLMNAHQHGHAPVRLAVRMDTDWVRVEVTDGSASPARLLPYRAGLSERGVGLHLVRRLATQWGQTTRPDGKTVWATFDRKA